MLAQIDFAAMIVRHYFSVCQPKNFVHLQHSRIFDTNWLHVTEKKNKKKQIEISAKDLILDFVTTETADIGEKHKNGQSRIE